MRYFSFSVLCVVLLFSSDSLYARFKLPSLRKVIKQIRPYYTSSEVSNFYKTPKHTQKKGSVTPFFSSVRDQGQHKNSALFATLALLEQTTGIPLSVSCSYRYLRGGLSSDVMRSYPSYLISFFQERGVISEAQCPYAYPYAKGTLDSFLSKKEYKMLVEKSGVDLSSFSPSILESSDTALALNFVRHKLEQGHLVVATLFETDVLAHYRGSHLLHFKEGDFSCLGKNYDDIHLCPVTQSVVITGYDDQNRTLEFKNSKGDQWGSEGYGHMSYGFFMGSVTDLLLSQE